MNSKGFRKRMIKDRLATVAAVACVIAALVPLVSILMDVLVKGLPQFSFEFLTGTIPPPGSDEVGGIGPAIVGTLAAIGIGSLIGIPIGIVSGIFVSEYGDNLFGGIVRFSMDVLAGFPSIIIGIFAYLVLVVSLGGPNAFAGGLALSIIMMPVVARTTEEALRLVPSSLREASLSLGVSRSTTIRKVVLSNGRPGIITGIMLSIARITGESAPLLLTVGWTVFYPTTLSQPMASMPVLIYQFAISPFENWHDLAWGASAFLILLVLGLNVTVRMIAHGGRHLFKRRH